jgi:FKBP-type peptidyl-prolyl cis-trans isomerase SlyD
MTIAKDTVVSITYVLTNNKGEVLDESGEAPLVYLHGHENIVPGLENALEGLSVGAAKSVSVAPAEGYGEYDPQMKFDIPTRGQDPLPPVGAMVELQGSGGHRFVARVVAADKDKMTLDANHPLAGETLNFDVKITDLRSALPDEIAHGHVHGAGCHHH